MKINYFKNTKYYKGVGLFIGYRIFDFVIFINLWFYEIQILWGRKGEK